MILEKSGTGRMQNGSHWPLARRAGRESDTRVADEADPMDSFPDQIPIVSYGTFGMGVEGYS